MGMVVDGVWQTRNDFSKQEQGRFKRAASRFRNWVTSDGSAGPSGTDGFAAESGRYHLYVSYACPWAHRTLIFRALKGLEEHISVSVVHYFMGDTGWEFHDREHATVDHLHGSSHMWQVYTSADPAYSGRVTVPVLWDKQRETIVSNESSEIIRMFNSAFNGLAGVVADIDFYPEALHSQIDAINDPIYNNVNNGVYKCGFATTQEAYEEAFDALFSTLDMVEERLTTQRYLMGDAITEADWRLFPTLLRFDPVYVGHFKCNRQRIADYPALSGYLRELYQWPGVAETVNMTHIKNHYYMSHETVNPTRIVPKGPIIDLTLPHGRDAL
ncbi:MAG: glutathione S-transferase family protein [Pseudomonadota bacterium]